MPVDAPETAEAPAPAPKEDRRLVLVTGASRGLGRAVAKALAAEGAHCILTARTVGALEELDDEIVAAGGSKPTLVPLDLREGDRIDQLGAALYERFGRLDGLAACAGVLGRLSPVGHLPPAVWDEVYAVNTTANYRLLRSLDPLLRRSAAGRAVFVTDVRARQATAYWALYAGSKAALEVLVRSYAQEIQRFGIKANLVSPPPMATALRRLGFPGEDQETLPKPEAIAPQLLPLLSPACERNGEIVEATA